jgi:hypothetical protein
LSDVLCSIATGAGFRTRALTTDSTETIFAAARPVVINSIAEIVKRGDLVDRALVITLAPVSEAQRQTEAAIDQRFAESHPAILAALADAVVQALAKPVTLDALPRMADFAVTIESAAPALGWEPGAFLQVYATAREEATASLLDGNVITDAMRVMRNATRATPWQGTSSELLDRLTEFVPEGKRDQLPTRPKGLVTALRRFAPALRAVGVDVQLPARQETAGAHRGKRLISINYPKASASTEQGRLFADATDETRETGETWVEDDRFACPEEGETE